MRSRDPDNDKFLECAVADGVDDIVSADGDLLNLGELERIPVVDALARPMHEGRRPIAGRAPLGSSGDFSMREDGFARATTIFASCWQGDDAVFSANADTGAGSER